jgi:hypothetical protein
MVEGANSLNCGSQSCTGPDLLVPFLMKKNAVEARNPWLIYGLPATYEFEFSQRHERPSEGMLGEFAPVGK